MGKDRAITICGIRVTVEDAIKDHVIICSVEFETDPAVFGFMSHMILNDIVGDVKFVRYLSAGKILCNSKVIGRMEKNLRESFR